MKQCPECGWTLPAHDFTCSQAMPLPGWRGKTYDWPAKRRAEARKQREREDRQRLQTEALGRPWHRSGIEPDDLCPCGSGETALDCGHCWDLADRDDFSLEA